jgi:hypothetical protein
VILVDVRGELRAHADERAPTSETRNEFAAGDFFANDPTAAIGVADRLHLAPPWAGSGPMILGTSPELTDTRWGGGLAGLTEWWPLSARRQ